MSAEAVRKSGSRLALRGSRLVHCWRNEGRNFWRSGRMKSCCACAFHSLAFLGSVYGACANRFGVRASKLFVCNNTENTLALSLPACN